MWEPYLRAALPETIVPHTDPEDPAIVFIDHELAGEDGISPVAPSFDALLTMLEAGN